MMWPMIMYGQNQQRAETVLKSTYQRYAICRHYREATQASHCFLDSQHRPSSSIDGRNGVTAGLGVQYNITLRLAESAVSNAINISALFLSSLATSLKPYVYSCPCHCVFRTNKDRSFLFFLSICAGATEVSRLSR